MTSPALHLPCNNNLATTCLVNMPCRLVARQHLLRDKATLTCRLGPTPTQLPYQALMQAKFFRITSNYILCSRSQTCNCGFWKTWIHVRVLNWDVYTTIQGKSKQRKIMHLFYPGDDLAFQNYKYDFG